MRLPAMIPFLFALTAFILSLLCVFAGSKRGDLENADIVTVCMPRIPLLRNSRTNPWQLNTSMIGHMALTPSSSSSSSLLSSLENDLKGGINKLAGDIAKELGLHDFYSWHILDYCEGYYTPSAIVNATSHPAKNVTHCSNQTTFFHFDPTATLQRELKTGFNLTELKWPQAIEDVVTAVEMASNAMFVLYCIGIATAGAAILGSVVGLLAGGRLSALVNLMLAIVGCTPRLSAVWR